MLWSFILPSFFMGLGIAIDVAIATIAQFRNRSMSLRNWTLPVSATHILFPAAGYYSWWLMGEAQPWLLAPLGLTAFTLIALFLYESFKEAIDEETRFSISDRARAMLPNLVRRNSARILMILAVSMDALWSGPAKAAQTVSGNWSTTLVLISFVIAGGVVAVVAQMALFAARLLDHLNFTESPRLARWLVAAKYAEFTILGGFGVLSVWNAFSFQLGLGRLPESLLIASGLFLILWAAHWRKLVAIQEDEIRRIGIAECHPLSGESQKALRHSGSP